MQSKQRPAQALDVMVRRMGDNLYISRSGLVLRLNTVGSDIWSLCDGRNDTAAIVAHVTADYAVSAEEATGDVDEFIARLAEDGFIEY